MPTYLSEVFHAERAASILTGVALPIFSMVASHTAATLNQKVLHNELKVSALFFLLGFASLGILLVFHGRFAASVLFLTFAVGSAYGANYLLGCMVPLYYVNTGRMSLIAGMLNAGVYIGSAVSAYGIGALATNAGWNVAIEVWCAVSAGGAVLCLLAAKPWKRFAIQQG